MIEDIKKHVYQNDYLFNVNNIEFKDAESYLEPLKNNIRNLKNRVIKNFVDILYKPFVEKLNIYIENEVQNLFKDNEVNTNLDLKK